VVVGGGSLLQDVTSFRSLAYYFFLLRWAIFWQKPVIFYGGGLGPFQRNISRWVVSKVLHKAFLLLRDAESERLALSLGVSPEQVFGGVDPVFSLAPSWRKSRNPHKIVFFLRALNPRWEVIFYDALQSFKKKVSAIELVAFHKELDGECVERMAKKLGVQGVFFDRVEKLQEYFAEIAFVFSMRLHPLVLATMLGVPWFGFDLDPKIRSLSAPLGGGNLLSLEELSGETLWSAFQRGEDITPKLGKMRELFLERSYKMEETLGQVLTFWERRK
ncbi:MAG: polysaccharide pyruvyl transferase family protein, partial [Candidatus Caldatribacteriaceae bacterium]